jgi:hypothetical protein
MEIAKILADLKEERRNLDEAIAALERLARGSAKRRGRPPAWMAEAAPAAAVDTAPKKRGRPPGSKNRSKAE